MKGTKRIQVTFTADQWKLIESLRGVFGSNDAEIVRGIVLAWLAEKSLTADVAKGRLGTER